MLRVLFYGTPDFAIPTLTRLIEGPHEVVAVVTQPDKPKGRGRKLAPPPVKVLAEENGIPVLQPKSVKKEEFLKEIDNYKPDVAVVIAYGKILPKAVLDLPELGSFNVHASILPKYRGAAPIQWAIAKGETKTGVTIMKMDEGLDTGDIALIREVDILEDDDAISLANMLSLVGAEAMATTLQMIEEKGNLELTPQDDEASTYAPLINREDALIDWTSSRDQVICLIRGFVAWPKAYTFLDGKEVIITGAEGCSAEWVPPSAKKEKVEPGTVVDILKNRGIAVKAGGDQEFVLVTRVKPSGKPEMGAFDFANGGGVSIGDLFKKESR